MKETVLVTGGLGFIGHNLVNFLLTKDKRVILVDNESTGDFSRLPENENCVYYKEDIREYKNIDNIFKKENPKKVFHLAALPRVQFSIKEPILTNSVNVVGTLNMLEISRTNNVERFIYSASSSAYGKQKILPLKEDMLPNPLSPYALQKFIGEVYCKIYNDIHGLKTISLRYFNVFGPSQSPDSEYAALIPKFIDLMSKGQTPKINGDGSNTRDFTSVCDVVLANYMSSETDNKLAFGEVFNVGGGNQISIQDVYEKIRNILKVEGNVEYGPSVVESNHTKANISKIKEFIGWEPTVSFDVNLENTVSYILNKNKKV